jgi:hypothetical protein
MRSRFCILLVLAALLPPSAVAADGATSMRRIDGFNVIAAPHHPFGGASATISFGQAKKAGAAAVAIVPFLWQPAHDDPAIARGSDMTDDELRNAIRSARGLGMIAIVKPHVWINGSWAGAVTANSEADWHRWFDRYAKELVHIAAIAAEEEAEILCIGTELAKTTSRSEWNEVIDAVRAVFPGELTYAAHNIEEAEAVPFWARLDAVGVTLYPPLGADDDRAKHQVIMGAIVDRLEELSARTAKRILVTEIGIRSAVGAAARPWESAEERDAEPDPALQASILADWLQALARPFVRGILVWRWFTDPNAGGIADTDFTVQNKPAQDMLQCQWTKRCIR